MQKPFPDDSFLARWLNGQLSKAEQQELEQRSDYEQLKKIAERSSSIDLGNFSEEEAWKNLVAAKAKQTRPTLYKRLLPFAAVAASVAILAIGWWLFRDTTLQIDTTNETYAVQLPDGSSVTLNHNSTLRYDPKEWPDNRSLELKGEAFFEVQKGDQFMVTTEEGAVQVLGTSFNVWARNKELDVACFTGKVRVNYKQHEAILSKGMAVWSNQTDTLQNKTVQDAAPDWVDGVITFKSTRLDQVIQSIEKQFDVSIQLESGKDRLYSGFFKTDDLKAALKTVCEPMGLDYSFKDEKTIIIK